MIFRQLFDQQSLTYTYLLGDIATREAVLIDPVFEQARRDAALLSELGLKLAWTLETHVHADHVTAAWLHKQRLGSRIAVSAAGNWSIVTRAEPSASSVSGISRVLSSAARSCASGSKSYA